MKHAPLYSKKLKVKNSLVPFLRGKVNSAVKLDLTLFTINYSLLTSICSLTYWF